MMVRACLLFSVVILVGLVCSQPSPPPVNFKRVDLISFNPEAVCNDGSSAVYYYRAGSGSGSRIWTLYLEGGGLCWDKVSCESRWQYSSHFMTSTQLPLVLNDTTMSQDVNHWGINSSNKTANPHFYNANQVYIWYCTSDMWAGNTKTAAVDSWVFRGKVVVESVVQHLAKTQSISEAEYVLLTGFSAGGMGVLHNADFVGDLVHTVAPNATYKAFVDSGWLLDLPYYDQNYISPRLQMQTAYKNFNIQSDVDCMNVFAPSGEQWRCTFADQVVPFIRSPLFVAGYQYDIPFLGNVSPPPFNATMGESAYIFRGTYLMQSSSLPYQFAPNCYCHGVQSYDTRWNVILINGMSASSSVWSFLMGQTPSGMRNIDSCKDLGCNPTCSCVWPY
eukprot:TRINITY_DN4617_c0_g1_i3.p1 TRINITY_DN4617_c0_g1~~TRINITY_DN4617_c0_g1_i3.p1  ORF type:complete len:390 (+),score=63.77 TRINITY_DN4617_c0_g1_i3:3-1172(+)